ncbi:Purine nucleoside phosphorylase DeoD-type [compost metagenome]
METAALYSNASVSNKNALSILTVSDKPITGESLSAIDRQISFNSMMEFALELAINI